MSLRVPKRLAGNPDVARGRSFEKRTAQRVRDLLVPGSGSGYRRGDVRVPNLCTLECKSTKHDSFRVTTEMIERLESATFARGEIPVLIVELANGAKRVLVVPDWALERLLLGGVHDASGEAQAKNEGG